jgi:hypothetical protein
VKLKQFLLMKLFKKIDCLALGQFQEAHMSEKEIPALAP